LVDEIIDAWEVLVIVRAHRIRPVLGLVELDCIHILVLLLLLLLTVGSTCRLLGLRRRLIGLRRCAFLMLMVGLLMSVGWLRTRS
jgi:hypothetical protein